MYSKIAEVQERMMVAATTDSQMIKIIIQITEVISELLLLYAWLYDWLNACQVVPWERLNIMRHNMPFI